MQSLNQLQQMVEATRCALAHLSELGVEMIEEMTPELEEWCYSLDPEDEESFQRHPVLHQPPMTSPVDAISMHVMNAMVRRIRQLGTSAIQSRWPNTPHPPATARRLLTVHRFVATLLLLALLLLSQTIAVYTLPSMHQFRQVVC